MTFEGLLETLLWMGIGAMGGLGVLGVLGVLMWYLHSRDARGRP